MIRYNQEMALEAIAKAKTKVPWVLDPQFAKDLYDERKQLLAIVECGKELSEIFNDYDARQVVDSFTIQPMDEALKAWKEK